MSKRIYTELDSLLDTRLGTLIKLDEREATEIVKKGYRDRTSDDWELFGSTIKNDTYREAYVRRDGETLKLSRCSGVVPMLNVLVKELEENAIQAPFEEEIVLDVNTWPYQMTGDVKDVMRGAIEHMIGFDSKIELRSYSPIDISPKRIHDTWAGMIIYDFNDWLERHSHELQEVKLPTVSFITPALYRNKVPTKADLKHEDGMDIPAFAALEAVLSEYLTLHMVHPKYFSVVEV